MVARIIKNESVIQFSMKAFVSVIMTIFSIFFGFYLLVIQPKFEANDNRIEKIITEQSITNKEISTSINALNVNIATLSIYIENLKENKKK